jgi:hypothetical protein
LDINKVPSALLFFEWLKRKTSSSSEFGAHTTVLFYR